MSIHKQARAEAEKRYLVLEPGLNDITVGIAQATRNASKAFIAGFLAGHEAATRARVVSTVTELDALPVGSVVLDAHDNPWGHPRDGLASWVDLAANEDALLWWSCTRIDLPARVLYEPEETR